jgi:hypothetical protein
MDVLGRYLDDRDDEHARRRRPEAWLEINQPIAPAARLLAFDQWVRTQLSTRLEWPADPARRGRLLEQCRVRLETIVLDLWRRGWMLDGRALAGHILAAIDAVSAAQKKGGIRDFYAYFSRAVEAYVGANAEELQQEARKASSGPAKIGSLATSALAAFGVSTEPRISLPELVAQRRAEIVSAKAGKLREKLARERRLQRPCSAPADQPELPL